MHILVQHMKNGEVVEFEIVASVIAPDDMSVDEALEYAYRWTNNVGGSWSIKEKYLELRDGSVIENEDYNVNVMVLSELHEGGRGLRSTSMFDRMIVGDKTYEVDMMGFKEVA